jgi:hypothetical protein
VPILTLDAVLGARFADKRLLIVVDVEGAEDAMLQGATQTLTRTPRPTWMVEVNIDEHQPVGRRTNPTLMSTFERFWSAGYRAWTCTDPCHCVESTDLHAIVDEGRSTITTHNFIFNEGDASPL